MSWFSAWLTKDNELAYIPGGLVCDGRRFVDSAGNAPLDWNGQAPIGSCKAPLVL